MQLKTYFYLFKCEHNDFRNIRKAPETRSPRRQNSTGSTSRR